MTNHFFALFRDSHIPSFRPAVIAVAAGLTFAAASTICAAQNAPAATPAATAIAAQTMSSATPATTATPTPSASASSTTALAEVALPPVTVVASPETIPLVVTTDPKTPKQPLPASDGADYLKTIPGFTAIRSGGTNGDVVFRGMFGSRLNILTNGVALLGACPGRMDAPTSYISPESYDKVTVIKGPESVTHGPVGSAGTILFQRDTKRFEKPGMRFAGSLVGGSYGRNDQNIDLTAGNQQVYGRITANHAHSQDYKDGAGNVVPSQWDKWNTDAAIGITPDANTKIEITGGTGDGYARYAGRSMDGVHFRRTSGGLNFDKKHIGKVLERIEAQVYFNEADHVMDNYTLRDPDPMSGMSMPMAAEVRRRSAGGRLAATLNFGDSFQLITGMDAQTNKLDVRSGSDILNYADMPWRSTATMWNIGAFGELTWFASDTQRVISGLRVDREDALDSTVAGKSMKMPMPNPTYGQNRASYLPSAFVRYEQDLSHMPAMWYAGIGHSERFPDYWELFSPSMGPDGSVNAFSALKPEKTTQLDIGAQYKSEKLDAWVSAYAGMVQDFILFNYRSGGMMGSMTQASNVNARIMGGELGTTFRPTSRWRFETSLAYAYGHNADSGQALPQIPPLEARFAADYQYQGWSAGALWRVVAPQRSVALNEGNVVGKDFGPSAGFGIFSLHAQYDFNKKVQLTIGIDNLFDKAYYEHLNLAGNAGFGFSANTPIMDPGRTAWARLSVKM
jgi:iron complex outermembrane receptor protein